MYYHTPCFIQLCFWLLVSSTVEQLPLDDDVLTEFGNRCGFCGTNETEYNPSPISLCCTECSCQPDCETTENCCFESEPAYPYLNERRSSKECMYSVKDLTSTFNATRSRIQQFYMVTRCNEKHLLECTDEATCSCADTKVAKWGSFHPVYSESNDEIYKNIECAKCNGANDTELFVPVLSCKMTEAENTDAFLRFLYGRNYYDQCIISFRYKGRLTNLLPHSCFEASEPECDGSQIQIPWGVNLSASQIIDACNSNLFSPVIALDIYKNVFCAMCYGVRLANIFGCGDIIVLPQDSDRSPFEFSTLLDTTVANQPDNAETNKPLACAGRRGKNLVDCREIYCPTGQTWLSNGCGHIASEWQVFSYRTQMKLTPKEFVDALEYEQVLENYKSNAYSMFNNEIPYYWTVSRIYHEVTSAPTNSSANSTLSCSFPHGVIKQINVFIMYFYSSSLNQTNLLGEIYEFISQPWILKLGDKNITFESSGFLEFVHVKELDEHVKIDLYAGAEPSNENDKELVPEFKKLSVEDRRMFVTYTESMPPGLCITETFYCQQIRLRDEEFIMVSGMKVIYYKKLDRYLLDGEYVTVVDDNGKSVPQICLHGSGYYHIDDLPNTSSGGLDHQFLPLCFLLSVVVLFN